MTSPCHWSQISNHGDSKYIGNIRTLISFRKYLINDPGFVDYVGFLVTVSLAAVCCVGHDAEFLNDEILLSKATEYMKYVD